MLRRHLPLAILTAVLGLGPLTGCKVKSSTRVPKENITPEEKAAAARLKPAPDPTQKEIDTFRAQMHEKFSARRFDELEKIAEELRAQKTKFGDGGWKLPDFYEGLTASKGDPEPGWAKAESLHEEWLTAKPQSLTAHLAYVQFLTLYAWEARGSGYADTVSAKGWRLFEKRMKTAQELLEKARALPGKDPMWGLLSMRTGFGQSWPAEKFDAALKEGLSVEPAFWRLHIIRANALLPRWFGKPGEWEKYAAAATALPDGADAEVYARIVIHMLYYHGNLFQESRASWSKTREGLEALRQKYPAAKEFTSYTALLAGMANDRATAKAMFTELGDTYLPRVWKSPERFVHVKNWAETGKW